MVYYPRFLSRVRKSISLRQDKNLKIVQLTLANTTQISTGGNTCFTTLQRPKISE